ncbi:hypothetical protein pb186bvf_013581 [Paramecium bursaria]
MNLIERLQIQLLEQNQYMLSESQRTSNRLQKIEEDISILKLNSKTDELDQIEQIKLQRKYDMIFDKYINLSRNQELLTEMLEKKANFNDFLQLTNKLSKEFVTHEFLDLNNKANKKTEIIQNIIHQKVETKNKICQTQIEVDDVDLQHQLNKMKEYVAGQVKFVLEQDNVDYFKPFREQILQSLQNFNQKIYSIELSQQEVLRHYSVLDKIDPVQQQINELKKIQTQYNQDNLLRDQNISQFKENFYQMEQKLEWVAQLYQDTKQIDIGSLFQEIKKFEIQVIDTFMNQAKGAELLLRTNKLEDDFKKLADKLYHDQISINTQLEDLKFQSQQKQALQQKAIDSLTYQLSQENVKNKLLLDNKLEKSELFLILDNHNFSLKSQTQLQALSEKFKDIIQKICEILDSQYRYDFMNRQQKGNKDELNQIKILLKRTDNLKQLITDYLGSQTFQTQQGSIHQSLVIDLSEKQLLNTQQTRPYSSNRRPQTRLRTTSGSFTPQSRTVIDSFQRAVRTPVGRPKK